MPDDRSQTTKSELRDQRREELLAAVERVGVPEAVRRIKSVVQETAQSRHEFLPRPERATGDHLGRTDKDFAIEFGGYLADAVGQIRRLMAKEPSDNDELSDCWRALESAAYEFRKRAEKCRTN